MRYVPPQVICERAIYTLLDESGSIPSVLGEVIGAYTSTSRIVNIRFQWLGSCSGNVTFQSVVIVVGVIIIIIIV